MCVCVFLTNLMELQIWKFLLEKKTEIIVIRQTQSLEFNADFSNIDEKQVKKLLKTRKRSWNTLVMDGLHFRWNKNLIKFDKFPQNRFS